MTGGQRGGSRVRKSYAKATRPHPALRRLEDEAFVREAATAVGITTEKYKAAIVDMVRHGLLPRRFR
jgi:hypothetical protein